MPHRIENLLLVSANSMINPYPVYPLGLSFLQTALEKRSYRVRIWDCLVHTESELAGHLEWADAIGVSFRNVDNVSSTSPVGYLQEHLAITRRIRTQTKAPIIAGGSAFSIFPGEFIDLLQLDWGIQGEAESALPDLLDAWNQNRSFHSIPGLWYRQADGTIRANPTIPLPVDSIPSPRPDPSMVKAYLRQGGMLNIQTQRGCPLKCTYCTYPWIEGNRYRHRDPLDVVEEMHHLKDLGVDYVFITDSVFNTTQRHVEDFCRAILRSGLKMEWGCFARPKSLPGGQLDLMIEAGLRHLEFGSDSFSPTTLKTYGKSFTFEEILAASETAASRSVHTCHYIIFGGPGETECTIRETVGNSKKLPDAPIFAFTGMRIYPHTPLLNVSQTALSNKQLVSPAFYSPQTLEGTRMSEIIAAATFGLPNWHLSDHSDDISALTMRLRKKGKQGPLWEYLAVSRRLAQRE